MMSYDSVYYSDPTGTGPSLVYHVPLISVPAPAVCSDERKERPPSAERRKQIRKERSRRNKHKTRGR
jgi:hypothetical protein